MKKALPLAIASFFIATIAQAQFIKGKTLLGGTLAYTHTTGYYIGNNLILTPSVGKVIKTNLVLGVNVNYVSGQQKYDTANNSNSKYRSYGGSVFLRQYVPLLKNFYFYAEAAAGFNKGHATQTWNAQTDYKSKDWNAALSFTPGLTYAITKRLYVESGMNGFALISYAYSKTESTNQDTGTVNISKGSNFNVSTSLQSNGAINIGFRLLL